MMPADHPLLSSVNNPSVRQMRALQDSAGRQQQGRFLVEGRRAISSFLAQGWMPRHLLLRQGLEMPAAWQTYHVQEMSTRVSERLSTTRTPSGYLAVFDIPTPPAIDVTCGGLILVEIADPGNLGTLIRSATAFGWQQLLLWGGCDPYSAKAVAASAGALAGVHIHRIAADLPPRELLASAPLWCLHPRQGVDPRSLAGQAGFLVLGNEAHGLSQAWLDAADRLLTIPMQDGVESLNAAVAGSIACWCLRCS